MSVQERVEFQRPLLISAADVARQLGISERQVWRLVSSGELPSPVKLGRRSTRFRAAEIDEFVQSLGTR